MYDRLVIGDYTGSASIKTFAGYNGMTFDGLASYTGFAQLLDEVYGREVCPLG